MEWLKELIFEYGAAILSAVLTLLTGYLGMAAKRMMQKNLNGKTKQEAARIAVQAVEQMYKNLHGNEKLDRALTAASDILSDRGVAANESELRVLVEAALAEQNDVFQANSASAAAEETQS